MSGFASPLQLLDFQVLKYHFEVSDDGEPDVTCEQTGVLDFDLRFRDQEQTDCLLVLKHSINDTDEDFERCGVRVIATVGGVFDLKGLRAEYSETPVWTGFLLVNGLSILYTMLRQMVAQTAGQSPARGFQLPTVNMQEFLRLYAESEDADPSDAVETNG